MSAPEQNVKPRRTRVIRVEVTLWTMVSLMLVIIGLWFFIRLLPVVLVLVVALMIVGTLAPAVLWLEKRGVHRNAGIAIVFSVLFVSTVLLFVFTIPELVNQVKSLIDMEPALREKLAVDYPAPKLSLKDLNGETVSLTDYAGQVVLVNNWAYWCPPCRAEMPILERYYQDHQAENFTIIGIESGGPAQTVQYYVDQYRLTFPVWLDPKIKAVAAFGNRSLPNSYVIDEEGQVRLAWTGPISRAMLEQFVTPLLEQ